jgi:hypothetical protein
VTLFGLKKQCCAGVYRIFEWDGRGSVGGYAVEYELEVLAIVPGEWLG